MDTVNDKISEAVQIWTGWGIEICPCRKDTLLADRLGETLADELLPILRSLEDDFYQSDACHTASDLKEMSAIASEQFKEKHPNIADEIVKALAWCYTFDYK